MVIDTLTQAGTDVRQFDTDAVSLLAELNRPEQKAVRPPADRAIRIRARLISVARRLGMTLLTVVPILFISTMVCYGLLYLSPVNAAAVIFGQAGTPAKIHALAVTLGTNKPYLYQYWTWLTNAFHGNLGNSYYTHLPVFQSIMQRIPVDLTIGALALTFAIVIGFGAGIAAALNRGKLVDRLVTTGAAVVHSVPEFWLGILLVVLFAVHLRVLPASGYVPPNTSVSGWFDHAFLPALSLCFVPAAAIARQIRTGLVGVLSENFIVGATVRGLSRRRVLFFHALRNAAGPAVTVIGMNIPLLVGSAIIAEEVFGLPGIGQFALQSAEAKDMPVIQGVLVLLILLVLGCNILVNIGLGWLRPETRQSR